MFRIGRDLVKGGDPGEVVCETVVDVAVVRLVGANH